MLLGREVDDPARAVWGFVLCDKHTAGPDFLLFASAGVRLEIFWERFLKHQRKAFAHYACGVDGIHQGFDLGFEEIALYKSDHGVS